MFSLKRFIYLIGVLQLIFLILLTIDVNVNDDEVGRAIMGMVWGADFAMGGGRRNVDVALSGSDTGADSGEFIRVENQVCDGGDRCGIA